MNNLLESFKRFFKNKNTVTIIGVIVILVLLYIGYSSQINKAVNPVTVYVATETIQPRTEITSDMVQTIDMPNISVSEDVLLSRDSIVGRYSNINSVIPKGSMFFKDMVVDKQDLPDAPFMKLKEGNVAYNFPVDMQTTYGNSIFPGKFVDIYMKIGNGADEKVMIGKLIENVEVLAVKDSAGRAVFENTSEERTPAMMIIGLSQDHYNLLIKAYYLSDLGVVLYPVPREAGSANQATASTQELKEYIITKEKEYGYDIKPKDIRIELYSDSSDDRIGWPKTYIVDGHGVFGFLTYKVSLEDSLKAYRVFLNRVK